MSRAATIAERVCERCDARGAKRRSLYGPRTGFAFEVVCDACMRGTCFYCDRPAVDPSARRSRRRCAQHRYLHRHKTLALIDSSTPWEEDDRCWYVVAAHPEGLSLDEIGQLTSLSHERVRQILVQALAKLRRRAFVAELVEHRGAA